MKTYLNTDCVGLNGPVLLSCNAPAVSYLLHPSPDPFIPLSCSSRPHGTDRQTAASDTIGHTRRSGHTLCEYHILYETWSKMSFKMLQCCPNLSVNQMLKNDKATRKKERNVKEMYTFIYPRGVILPCIWVILKEQGAAVKHPGVGCNVRSSGCRRTDLWDSKGNRAADWTTTLLVWRFAQTGRPLWPLGVFLDWVKSPREHSNWHTLSDEGHLDWTLDWFKLDWRVRVLLCSMQKAQEVNALLSKCY